jgi:peptidyl-prolyl cis-trans isomerase SurA
VATRIRGQGSEAKGQEKIFLLSLCFLLICGLRPAASFAESINIAAVVNDDIITSTDLAERRDLVMALNGVPPTPENQQKITPRILASLIDETLEMQEAKRLSITVDDDEIGKAIAATEQMRHQPEGSLRRFAAAHGLSPRSLEAQIRAELAWSKVVQRKLRRNVSISQDEVLRAQQAQAAAPGVTELRLGALTVPGVSGEEGKAAALGKQLAEELHNGNMAAVALAHAKEHVEAAPPRWVNEESLPPPLQQALKNLNPGDVSPPLRTPSGFQLIQLIDRRVTKSLPDATEVVLKQIALPIPDNAGKDALEQLRRETLAVRAKPGTCTENTIGTTSTRADVRFVRSKLGPMDPELRALVSHLGVGEISDPVITPKAIGLIMLCEKIEPATTGLPDAEKVRQQLFSEKIALEAEKRLRDLKRDAFIDVKGQDAPR